MAREALEPWASRTLSAGEADKGGRASKRTSGGEGGTKETRGPRRDSARNSVPGRKRSKSALQQPPSLAWEPSDPGGFKAASGGGCCAHAAVRLNPGSSGRDLIANSATMKLPLSVLGGDRGSVSSTDTSYACSSTSCDERCATP